MWPTSPRKKCFASAATLHAGQIPEIFFPKHVSPLSGLTFPNNFNGFFHRWICEILTPIWETFHPPCQFCLGWRTRRNSRPSFWDAPASRFYVILLLEKHRSDKEKCAAVSACVCLSMKTTREGRKHTPHLLLIFTSLFPPTRVIPVRPLQLFLLAFSLVLLLFRVCVCVSV